MPLAPERLQAWLAEGHHGSMDWMAETARAPRRSAHALAGGAQRHPARPELRARRAIRWPTLAQKDRASISVYARNRDYHDVIKGKLKEVAGMLAARAGIGREGVRRYRAGDGKAAGRGGRSRLAGQAHGDRLARIRQLALPRRHLHRPPNCRPTSRRRIIAAPAGAASTSARRTPFRRPISSMRGAAFPT